MTRDELYFKLKENGVLGRRYFYPLISDFSPYKSYNSARKENLPNANKLADTVICLPMHAELTDNEIEKIVSIIIKK